MPQASCVREHNPLSHNVLPQSRLSLFLYWNDDHGATYIVTNNCQQQSQSYDITIMLMVCYNCHQNCLLTHNSSYFFNKDKVTKTQCAFVFSSLVLPVIAQWASFYFYFFIVFIYKDKEKKYCFFCPIECFVLQHKLVFQLIRVLLLLGTIFFPNVCFLANS